MGVENPNSAPKSEFPRPTGFGGAVAADGRYGWVGGTGTAAHVASSTGTIGILLTQLQMTGPTPTQLMREFWQYAFGVDPFVA